MGTGNSKPKRGWKDKALKMYKDGIPIRKIVKDLRITIFALYSLLKISNVEKRKDSPGKILRVRMFKEMSSDELDKYVDDVLDFHRENFMERFANKLNKDTNRENKRDAKYKRRY